MAIGDDEHIFMTCRNLQMARHSEQPEITPSRPSKKILDPRQTYFG
jgi:hypothetical protein